MRHFGLAQTSPSRDQRTNFDPTQPLDSARSTLDRDIPAMSIGVVVVVDLEGDVGMATVQAGQQPVMSGAEVDRAAEDHEVDRDDPLADVVDEGDSSDGRRLQQVEALLQG